MTPSPTPSPPPTPTPTWPPVLSPSSGAPLSFSLGWRFDAGGHLTAVERGPGGVKPSAFLASLDRRIYALRSDGQTIWQARGTGPVYSLTVLHDGRVAAGDDAGQITLYSSAGRWLGSHDLGSRVTDLHGGWQGGLLAGGWDERLTFLNLEGPGGSVLWQRAVNGPVSAIAALPDLAVAATLTGELQAFDPDGREIWRFAAGTPVTGLGVAGSGAQACLLAAVQDGSLLCLTPSGALRWARTFGPEAEGSPIWHAADLDSDGRPEIIAGTGGTGSRLAVLSLSGEWRLRLALPAPVNAVLTVDLDTDGSLEILAGLASGEVQVFEARCPGEESSDAPVTGVATGTAGDCLAQNWQKRGSVHAGLPVWDLLAAGPEGSPWVLALADVVAWQLTMVPGPAGGPWLPPPTLVDDPSAAANQSLVFAGSGEAVLVVLGDVGLGRSMEYQLGRYGPAYPWTGLAPLLSGADLVAVNLEGALTRLGTPLGKPYILRAHPLWAKSLVEANAGLVTLANNHVLDFGPAGLDETVDTLAAVDIATVGAGGSAAEARQPAEFTLNGVRVAVLGYAAARWDGSVDVPNTDRLAWARPDEVQVDVRAVRGRADLVVVLLHAGTEYAATPSADQVAVARAAVEAGADLIVGHHPHVTQTVERYWQGLIVYSLGDALFDIPRRPTMQGDLLRVIVSKEGLVRAELWPFWIEDAVRPRLLAAAGGSAQVKVIFSVPR